MAVNKMAPPMAGVVEKNSPTKSKKSSKRKVDDSRNEDKVTGKNTPNKKSKSNFTDLDFKVQLRDPNTSFSALEEFIAQVEKYEQGKSKYDIIEAYCRGSPECNEIFNLLEAGKRKTSELFSIVTVLNSILVRLSDDLPKLQPVATATARRILGQHLGAVYALLGMKNKSGQIKVALRLLMAMVLQGADMARLVVMQFDLSHYTIAPLLQRRDAKDPSDVRTCLLQFMMSLLATGDSMTIKQVVETKGFLNGIFAGMTADKVSTLQMVLPTLKEKVVENPYISKTIKIRLFNTPVLQLLGQLYNWKGPASWNELKQRKQTPQDVQPELEEEAASEEKEIVQQLTHDALMSLTCPFKTGINFHDKTLGTSQKNMNHVLTSLLTSLQRPYTSPLQCTLVSEVLKACPDQLVWYLPSLKHALAPRASTNWIQAMQLLHKVYSNQPEVSPALMLPDKVSVSSLTKMVLASLLPPKDVWLQVTKALQFPHRSVQHSSLQLLHCLLLRVKATLQACTKPHAMYTREQLGDMAQNLQDMLVKLLPSVGVLLKQWQTVVDVTGQDEESRQTAEESMETATAENTASQGASDVPLVGVVPHLLSLLQVISCYQEALPSIFTNQPLHLGPLVEGVLKLQADDEEAEESQMVSLLRLQLLRLLASASNHQVAWMKESLGGRTTISLLLEMSASTTRDTQLYDAACHLLGKLLSSTSLFEQSPHEVDIWLRMLGQVKTKAQPAVIAFLEKCLITLIKSPYQWADKVSELVAEAATMGMVGVSDSGSVTIQETAVERILSLDVEDLVLEESTDALTPTVQPVDHVQFPFSCLLPVALEVAKTGTKKGVQEYLDRVLLEVFSHQRDPRALCLLLHQNCDKTGSKLATLANPWLPKKMQMEIREEHITKGGKDMMISDQIHQGLSGNCAVNVSAITSLLDKQPLALAEADAVVRYLLLAVKHQIAFQLKHPQEEDLLASYLKLLHHALESLKEQEEDDIAIDAELVPLLPPRQTKLDISDGLYRRIVSDPDLQHYYLWKPDPSTSAKAGKAASKISSTASIHLSDILADVPRELKQRLQECIQVFTAKVLNHLSHSVDDRQLFCPEFISSVKAVIMWCSPEELHSLAGHILSVPAEVSSKSPDGMSPMHDVLQSILHQLVEGTTSSSATQLSPAVIDSLTQVNMSNSRLDSAIVALFRQKPLYCLAVKRDYLVHCLDCNSKLKAELVAVFVKYSGACRRWLLEYIQEHHSLKNRTFRENYLESILICYIMREDTGLLSSIEKRYWGDLSSFSVEPMGENSMKWSLLHELTKNVALAPAETLWKQLTKHVSGSLKVTQQQLAYLSELTEQVVSLSVEEDRCEMREGLLACLLQCLSHQCQNKGKQEHKAWILTELLACLKGQDISSDVLRNLLGDQWDIILKSCLRVLMRTARFFDVLQHLVPLMYGESDSAAVVQLYQMVVSHSAFLDIMLGDESPVKTALVKLLLFLAQRSSECCQSGHLGVLFGAYRASLSATDQSILLLLRTYEASGVSLTEFSPYLWGPAAAEQHALRKSLGPSLSKQPSTAEVLDALDKDRVLKSALAMPLTRQLQSSAVYENAQLSDPTAVYDPAFLLPLFSQLLAPEMLINCRNFVACHALGYTCAALSCHDAALRGLAYHVLTRFQTQLEGARFAEKPQVTYLLECLQNSVESPGAKLAPLLGIYLSLAVELLLLPRQHMFSLVTSFVLLKPTLDLGNVPDFFKLFNSAAQQFSEERAWVLSLLEKGLRETADYRIAENRFTFKLLLSFYDSALCSQDMKLQILRIVQRACELKSVGFDLVKHHGLLAWLSGAASNSGSDRNLLGALVEIVCSLWQSQLGDRDQLADDKTEEGANSRPCLPVIFTNEMLQIMLLIATMAKPPLSQFSRYMKYLGSVLSHLKKTAGLARDGAFTVMSVRPSTLHCLLLTWQWAHRHGNRAVVEQMEELLTASGADEVVPALRKESATSVSVTGRGKIVPVTSVEDTVDDKMDEEGDLEALLQVICHWRPSVMTSDVGSFTANGITDGCYTEPGMVKAIVLTMTRWALSALHQHFPGYLQLQLALVTWLRDAYARNKASLCPALLGSQACAKDITCLLLCLYDNSTQYESITPRSSEDNDMASKKSSFNNKSANVLRKSLTEQLNQIFMILMDVVNAEDQFKTHPVRTLLNSAGYRKVVRTLKQQPNAVSQEALHHIVGSLWLAVPQPEHALALLQS